MLCPPKPSRRGLFLCLVLAQFPALAAGQEPPSDAPNYTPEELANIRVYESVNQSVVNITTSTVQMDRLFGLAIEGEGVGSGAVIDKQGHIITNQHVIDGAQEVQVTFADGESYQARLVGQDEEYDLAVLKVDAPAESLQPITVRSSDRLLVGQKTYVLGNPFGLGGTLTSGIISNLNRSLPSRVTDKVIGGMIQTDAAMNPGNSGGPMLDSSGQMIGMCIAIKGPAGQNSGVGFAIPSNRILRFVPELIEHGRVIRAYHGIVMLSETSRGLRIAKITPGGPAEAAGLRGFRVIVRNRRQGNVIYREQTIDRDYADFIVAIDGKQVTTHQEFLEMMDSYRPQDRVVFTIRRGGRSMQVPVTMGAA